MERDAAHIALFAAMIAALGLVPQITLAFGVPITAQSLGVMLAGAVLGALLIWFLWIKAEVWGPALMSLLTLPLSEGGLRRHLIESAPQMRYVAMGLVLLLVLRFAPRGLVPER